MEAKFTQAALLVTLLASALLSFSPRPALAYEMALIAETDCASKIADLDRLFLDRDDDFPSQVNRKALIDFLTVENKILFSNAFYEAVSATLIEEHFILPQEKQKMSAAIWAKFVERASQSSKPAAPGAMQDDGSLEAFRVFVNAINDNQEIKNETVKIISESLGNAIILARKSSVERRLVSRWKTNRGGSAM